MKLLVFGGQGMLGHLLVQYFQKQKGYHVFYTTRDKQDSEGLYVDARDPLLMEKVMESVSPHVTINCMGILNQFALNQPQEAYWVNGFVPHFLGRMAKKNGGKLIHISTDCVFSGLKGGHTENDPPDGTSVYAVSKALGEITAAPHLTVRTSIIGPEIREQGIGLMHWFMQREGEVDGYSQAFWNGVTTLELAKCIRHIIESEPITGLLHVTAPEPISKFELLGLFREAFHKKNVTIRKNDSVRIDRTLRNTRNDFHYLVPDYETMLHELREWMWGQ